VFRRLGQIEHRLGARLFKRSRARYVLTPQGEELVQLAARMESEVAAFERGLQAKTPGGKIAGANAPGAKTSGAKTSGAKPFLTGLVPPGEIVSRGGLSFLKDMVARKVPQAPMCATLGFHLAEVAEGFAAFEGTPELRHYNPIGTVHGGFAATLLDSALGSAIFSTMVKGEAWTTLELKLNLVRPIGEDTGTVRAEGRIVHRGRTVATADGTLKDRAGKLYAHASTTCMVFPAKG
jgi:uncharacterized protein (TIGR00369 family)